MTTSNRWHPQWTYGEDLYLCLYWRTTPAIKIAVHLNRSLNACYKRARVLKVRSTRKNPNLFTGANFKGAIFYEQVLADFANHSYYQIAQKHGVPNSTAKSWIHRAKQYRDRGKICT